ncbi:hypothetical protein ORV05_22730 [Amycolatopsis cynarae]|uniref:Uncharacterized protein n=1 Tax=Amycolatopsis cynarae TaxID=2995223 RepID=A0ABY7AXZ8_9PSEU|nr:hypothetical protein [Amycolatopsis sp. HUAS 11-8]WAL63802.1 hypothetical protein ORV05_22730 [Amycolatopsis sp. HUAS 11-8]
MNAHNYGCAHAKRHECRCKLCAGTLHRWPGCLELALEPTGVKRAAFRNGIDAKWNKSNASRKQKGQVSTKSAKESATDSGLADIIDWLALHPVVTGQIEAIANVLGRNVVNELDKSLDADHRDQRRRALLDHFWCDLLAAFANVLAVFQHQIDQIPGRIANVIIVRRDHGARLPIDDADIKMAVESAWKLIRTVPFVKVALPDVEEPLRAIQMLAVMICPAPERHGEVVKYCLHPLTGEVLTVLTKQRLEAALPADWLS